MSIYSGFATRKQQEAYDSLVFDLITVLQRRIIKFYLGQQADQQKFYSVIQSLQEYLRKMELNKYQQPKLSQTLIPLLQVTASVSPVFEFNNNPTQSTPENGQSQNDRSFSLSKKSVPILPSEFAFGKIKHQSLGKDPSFIQCGPLDPENYDQLQSKLESFAYVPAHYRRRKWAQRQMRQRLGKSSVKNNLEYVIRQYIGRSKSRKLMPRKDGSS